MFGFFRRKNKLDIDSGHLDRLYSAAKEYVKGRATGPLYRSESESAVQPDTKAERVYRGSPQFSESDYDSARVQYSQRDTGSGRAQYSKRDSSGRITLQSPSSSNFYATDETVRQLSRQIKTKQGSGFTRTVQRFIEEKQMKDSAVYKAAEIDRRHFSKMMSNGDYKPNKNTCLALALALKLNLSETKELLGTAGYTLSSSITRDLVIEFCIQQQEYSLMYVNDLLDRFGVETIT